MKKLERLVWNGFIRNDSFSIIRYYMDIKKKNSLWTKYNTYPSIGRWGLIEENIYSIKDSGVINYVKCLLGRYGIISKEIVNLENGSYRWSEIYNYLSKNEFITGIKRGLYVSGFSSIQFARDTEINMLRISGTDDSRDKYMTVCSCDPLLPKLNGFVGDEKVLRHSGTAIVFKNGAPVLVVKGHGRVICPLNNDKTILKKAVFSFINIYCSKSLWCNKKYIFTEFWENENTGIEKSPVYNFLLESGFDKGYREITLWPKNLSRASNYIDNCAKI